MLNCLGRYRQYAVGELAPVQYESWVLSAKFLTSDLIRR